MRHWTFILITCMGHVAPTVVRAWFYRSYSSCGQSLLSMTGGPFKGSRVTPLTITPGEMLASCRCEKCSHSRFNLNLASGLTGDAHSGGGGRKLKFLPHAQDYRALGEHYARIIIF